jgi:2-polyprenyl-3-methyl-5-hydroxy-6-metoxy-1,4-benzoquinol methylase
MDPTSESSRAGVNAESAVLSGGAAANDAVPGADAPFDAAAPNDARTARWSSEATFFDRIADQIGGQLRPLEPAVVERYRKARRSWCNKEFRFQLLGDLRGKRVLDVGCGEGTNAVLLAKLGAQVTGIDISQGSVEICRRRAVLDGVDDRTTFICSPLETVALEAHGFDVIWGDGVLHHLIPELPSLMQRLLRWARPGARFVFSEPVSLVPALRRLRAGIPIHTDATPDERPLQRAEVEIVRDALPDLEMRWFDVFGRLGRFLIKGHSFERSSLPRRLAMDACWLIDDALLSIPKLGPLGGMCVMYGSAP